MSISRKPYPLAILLAMLISLWASACRPALTPSVSPTNTPATVLLGQASLIAMDLDDLVSAAELIVLGQVETVYPSRWNTSDGQLPEGMTLANIDFSVYPLFTDHEVRVLQVLKGHPEQDHVRVRTFGGEYEGIGFVYFPSIVLEQGQTYLFLLGRCPECSTGHIIPEHYICWEVFTLSDNQAIPQRRPLEYEFSLDDLIEYIRTTAVFRLRMPQGNPFLAGERITLAQLREILRSEIPVPPGRQIQEIWGGYYHRYAFAIWFDDGLLCIIKIWGGDPPKREALLAEAPQLQRVEVQGYLGVGTSPGILEKDGQVYSYPGQVMLWLDEDFLTVALYSEALSLEALLDIAEAMPWHVLLEKEPLPTYTPMEIPMMTEIPTATELLTETPTPTLMETPVMTEIPTATELPTETPTPTLMETPVMTEVPTATELPTETPTPTPE